MKRFATMLLAAMMLVSVVQAQDESKPYELYGFASFVLPTENSQEFDFDWARVGLYVYPEEWLTLRMEYDVSSSELKYAYAQRDWVRNGITYSVVAGRHLDPVAYLYPGPSSLELTRWPDTLNAYSVYDDGVALWAEGDRFVLRASYYEAGDNREMSAATTWRDWSLFWRQDAAWGVGWDPDGEESRFGRSKWSDLAAYLSTTQDEEVTFSVVDEVQLSAVPNISLWVQGDVRERGEADMLAGLVYTYREDSFIKLFWDGKDKSWQARMTFTF